MLQEIILCNIDPNLERSTSPLDEFCLSLFIVHDARRRLFKYLTT